MSMQRVRQIARDGSTELHLRRYLHACELGAPVKPGLISNPMARTNWRSVAHDRLVPRLPDPEAAVSTPSVSDLPSAVEYLLFHKGCNVLAINGGDGTIHHTVNATLAVIDRQSDRFDRHVPLPRFLFLNGGGMNMLARAFETRGHPLLTIRRFLDQTWGRQLSAVATREVPLLAVHQADETCRRGFIFGSELVLNALTMYERYGQGYRGLARLLGEATAGYALKTETWQRYGHLLDPPATPATVDGVTFARYTAAVAATVPMTLVRGLVVTLPDVAAPGTFDGLLITETGRGRVLRLIPRLMRAGGGPGLQLLRGARELALTGPYTIDGERMTRTGGGSLVVRGSSRTVTGVWLG